MDILQGFVEIGLERTAAAQLEADVPGSTDNPCGDFQQFQAEGTAPPDSFRTTLYHNTSVFSHNTELTMSGNSGY